MRDRLSVGARGISRLHRVHGIRPTYLLLVPGGALYAELRWPGIETDDSPSVDALVKDIIISTTTYPLVFIPWFLTN
jgi:hypothetical protein